MKRNHRSLKAWQESIVLVEHVYEVTRTFPKEELFGLTSQMRRSSVSVPANIAEGSARAGTKELIQFLSVAAASLSERDTHVEISIRLGYLQDDALTREIDDVAGLLMGLDLSRILCVRHTMSTERDKYAEASKEDAESQRGRAGGGVAQDSPGVA